MQDKCLIRALRANYSLMYLSELLLLKFELIWSLPGNLRNKYALPPGHSLMDWIRLGSSGKDLTGVGPQAGNLSVKNDDTFLNSSD